MSYNKKVLDIFKKPHNMGEMKNPDAIGKVGNPVCGDVMWVYIKVAKNKDKKEIIKDIKVKTFGCVAAIATSSIVTDLAKGKTLDEAAKISKKDILNILGELPPQKIHCSVLAQEALADAIVQYKKRSKAK